MLSAQALHMRLTSEQALEWVKVSHWSDASVRAAARHDSNPTALAGRRKTCRLSASELPMQVKHGALLLAAEARLRGMSQALRPVL